MNTQVSHCRMRKQQGLVVVIVTVAMMVMLGVAALAVDINHAYTNRTKLQNSVDAAALAAAVVLDKNGTEDNAKTIAIETLSRISAGDTGNGELDFSNSTIDIKFNNDSRFTGGGCVLGGDCYVRVVVTNLQLQSFFMQLFNDTKVVSASAVAGPSAGTVTACNLVPMAVCKGDQGSDPDSLYGYKKKYIYELKVGDQNNSEMGPGNFQLLDFGSGADGVREGLAGGYGECQSFAPDEDGNPATVDTKPGESVGPVAQGLNTRLGVFKGGIKEGDYKSDVYIGQPSTLLTSADSGTENTKVVRHENYPDQSAACVAGSGSDCKSGGEVGRRELVVPIVDCTGAGGGAETLDVVALGCFYLLQEAPDNNSEKLSVFGEFFSDCSVKSGTGDGTSRSSGPHRIVLYKDPDNEDS
ncbi:Tad domain-containing protein [Vibrio fluvialis]|uniref:Tad domain-containing protein n=1 Tax=Vibrio fluvialis TaxID=676 RepID=UPI0005C9389C|nr:Tad domain-containing protein [Vibrio fluvialis]ELI5734354.1 Tad domain-containing protein [Vibrio fluvialis]MBY7896629.1 Tad domain-containing protein [Vibrio fluvialis]MBY8087126.1 Tad domain-containing protein [Vibrio fluvialis]